MDNKNKTVDDLLKERSFSQDFCFLCNAKLSSRNKTDEHIFPKWLLHKFNLWDQKLTLLNQTPISYRHVKIPCCDNCNNRVFSVLEQKIQMAAESGYDDFVNLDELTIFQWLLKIMYEIIYLELRLALDRSNTKLGTIITKPAFKKFETVYLFLQSLRYGTKFEGTKPWSIFLFNTQEYDRVERNFDFIDNVETLSIALRIGDIGIIGCLADNNSQCLALKDDVKRIQKIKIHPLQFRELAAKHFYKALLLNRSPKYILVDAEQKIIISLPTQGLSTKPIYNKWEQKDYARVLSFYTGLAYQDIYKDGMVWSILWDENSKPRRLDIKKVCF